MSTIGTVLTAAVTATVIIGGVVYLVKRRVDQIDDPNIVKKNELSSSDVLEWIDEILKDVQIKPDCIYSVNILPNSSTIRMLNKPIKNAYCVMLLENAGENLSYLRRRIYIVKELSSELSSLKDDKIVEIPIQL